MKNNKINKYYDPGQPKICKICGKEFAVKGGSKYCSAECKRRAKNDNWNKSHHEIIKKICPICGKEFDIEKQKLAKQGRAKYCSVKCRERYARRSKYKRLCIICGKEFISKHIKAKTCSGECLKQIQSTPRRSDEEKLITLVEKRKRHNHSEMILARTDPAFALKRRMRTLMYHNLRRAKGGRKWQDLVGYTVDDLRRHIEKQFTDGMSWEQFLAGNVHIDHKTPVSAHNITSPNDPDFKNCWSLKNLQPLWWYDNLSKHNRLDKPFQPSLAIGA